MLVISKVIFPPVMDLPFQMTNPSDRFNVPECSPVTFLPVHLITLLSTLIYRVSLAVIKVAKAVQMIIPLNKILFIMIFPSGIEYEI